MPNLQKPQAVFFFVSWICHSDLESKIMNLLHDHFDCEAETLYPKFNPSLSYYSKEMGDQKNLIRGISFFCTPSERDLLVEHKKWSLQIEDQFSEGGARKVNFDPGYLALEQVVLATGKAYSHRVYLQDNLYAELTLQFQNGAYQGFAWTYPDYLEPEKLSFFQQMRKKLLHSRS